MAAADVSRVEIGFDGGLIVITKIAAKEWAGLEETLKSGKGVATFSGDENDEQRRKTRKDRKVGAVLHTGMPIRFWDHELGVELVGGDEGIERGLG